MEHQGQTGGRSGLMGRLGSLLFASPLRHLEDILIAGDFRREILREVAAAVGSEGTVLDVGAGAGYLTIAIAGMLNSCRVIGLDPSERMLDRLERGARNKGLGDRVQILKATASDTGLKSGTVDAVVSMNVLHELEEPLEALVEMERVLKHGGLVAACDFRDTWLGRWTIGHHHDAGSPFSVDRMEAVLGEAGLSEIRTIAKRHEILGIGIKP